MVAPQLPTGEAIGGCTRIQSLVSLKKIQCLALKRNICVRSPRRIFQANETVSYHTDSGQTGIRSQNLIRFRSFGE